MILSDELRYDEVRYKVVLRGDVTVFSTKKGLLVCNERYYCCICSWDFFVCVGVSQGEQHIWYVGTIS